jgi:D-methionine transport system ATP-binding protein
MTDVVKSYPPSQKGGAPVAAIDGVSVEVERGDVYGIIGYSGAGKSTLVRLVNGLEKATSGSIVVNGTEITSLKERSMRAVRGDIGMIFQQFNLFNSKTVAKNVAYPLEVAGRPAAEITARVAEMLAFVGLSDKAKNYPDQLSGGQKQRVGIARALATSPSLLLSLLDRVNRELGVTIILITHEMDVIRSLATKVAVMDGGRIVERGDVFDVFSNPQNPASARFVSTVVQGVPSPVEVQTLQARHNGRIVTFSFRDGNDSQAQVFLDLAAAGIRFELVYGGINDIRGRAFGHLTLALQGDEAALTAALAQIATHSEVTEAH